MPPITIDSETLDGKLCMGCDCSTSETLIEVFPGWNSPCTDAKWVCGSCLVGCMVPVIRPSTDKWEFGVVDRVNSKEIISDESEDESSSTVRGRHCLRFMDNEYEWVNLPATTYSQYIDHYKCQSEVLSAFCVGQNGYISFGDDADMDEFVEEEMETIPRRLVEDFVSDGEAELETGRPLVKVVSSPHRFLVQGGLLTHQTTPTYSTSVASSISISTTDNISPFTTPESKYSSTSPHKRYSESFCSSAKYSQKLWTAAEDQVLLRAISSYNPSTLKWSLVAKSVPGRSGKQCRERYLNHLTPNIKLKNWSPLEDAAIFRLYHTDGSKWSMMSKLIRGRTDNGIKNRYHHLKRRLERQMQMVPASRERDSILSGYRKSPLLGFYEDFLLKFAAAQSLLPKVTLNESDADGYLRAGLNELCNRCGLFVPSEQTGRLVCKTTGWCEVCVRISPCVSGDLLRAIEDSRSTRAFNE